MISDGRRQQYVIVLSISSISLAYLYSQILTINPNPTHIYYNIHQLSYSLLAMDVERTYQDPNAAPNSPPQPQPQPQVVMSPCAACKILRRRCTDKCVLAPYFPPTDPAKFTTAHRVFGASNIVKFLQVSESERADAVSSMVYEAGARLRDPVYGCAGAICQLQKQVSELQAQLAKAQAQVVNMQCQQENLVAMIYMEMGGGSSPDQDQPLSSSTSSFHHQSFINTPPSPTNTTITSNCFSVDDNNSLQGLWEPLWT